MDRTKSKKVRIVSATEFELDGPQAWRRLWVALALGTLGGVGLWSNAVVLPAIQSEFGIDRGAASFPYMATMFGIAAGGIVMGRMVDRFGIMKPMIFGIIMLSLGYALAAVSPNYVMFVVIQTVFVGMLGTAVTFGPLVAEISLWFHKRRGIAVAVVASGNYLSGTIWPVFIQMGIDQIGWRSTYVVIAVVVVVAMLPLAILLRQKPVIDEEHRPTGKRRRLEMPLSKNATTAVLCLAGIACCVAMAMPQVHIVAYCADLGYGPARGAEMLSVMLALGIVSRLASGVIADYIGGLGTLILGSSLQCLALLLYLPTDGLTSLFIVSAVFGLSQGGIVPSYALIVRDYFPAREAGMQVSTVLMATVAGMALGGWMSGEIYDLTGSYQAAFINGIAWNALNMAIAFWLLFKRGGQPGQKAIAAQT